MYEASIDEPEPTTAAIDPSKDWIQLYSGGKFVVDGSDLTQPYLIDDIARGLAMKARFGGHVSSFYSVAEHCVLAARNVAPEFKRAALLHDAAEAYLMDVPRPIKYQEWMRGYREVEDSIQRQIGSQFGLPPVMPPEVKKIDEILWRTEALQLFPRRHPDWNTVGWDLTGATLKGTLPCWSWDRAMEEFLAAYAALWPSAPSETVIDGYVNPR